MLNVFNGVLTASWDLLLEMSPYLLLGFLANILQVTILRQALRPPSLGCLCPYVPAE